ncbi:hypothetical protein [Thermocatellispora tengchongensis]|uniref:hypothetical protein n=1 Tax=Thermocatellispora tengchongensis TaxID=1073253 RepID=UPI00363064CB
MNVRDYRIERLHRVFEDRAPDIAPFDSGLPGAELPGAELPDTELLNTAPSDTGMAVLAGIAALGKATETVRRPVGEGVENVENVENLEGVEGVSNVGGVHARRVQAHRESRTWRHRAFRPVVREARERVLTYAPAAKRVAADRLTRARAQAAVRMGHRQAVGRLLRAGLKWKSSGGCSDRHVHTCTSLDSVRTGTVDKVIALKRASRCPIMITGGTETGHAPGTYSHANGYKLDITANRCVTRYITRTFEPHGTRGDGAALYKSPGGDIYAHESDHWDIQFM